MTSKISDFPDGSSTQVSSSIWDLSKPVDMGRDCLSLPALGVLGCQDGFVNLGTMFSCCVTSPLTWESEASSNWCGYRYTTWVNVTVAIISRLLKVHGWRFWSHGNPLPLWISLRSLSPGPPGAERHKKPDNFWDTHLPLEITDIHRGKYSILVSSISQSLSIIQCVRFDWEEVVCRAGSDLWLLELGIAEIPNLV